MSSSPGRSGSIKPRDPAAVAALTQARHKCGAPFSRARDRLVAIAECHHRSRPAVDYSGISQAREKRALRPRVFQFAVVIESEPFADPLGIENCRVGVA